MFCYFKVCHAWTERLFRDLVNPWIAKLHPNRESFPLILKTNTSILKTIFSKNTYNLKQNSQYPITTLVGH